MFLVFPPLKILALPADKLALKWSGVRYLGPEALGPLVTDLDLIKFLGMWRYYMLFLKIFEERGINFYFQKVYEET